MKSPFDPISYCFTFFPSKMTIFDIFQSLIKKKCHFSIGYKSAIIRNAFSIGYHWCSVFFFSKTTQTREKRVAVPVTRNASVALQPKKYIGSCGSN